MAKCGVNEDEEKTKTRKQNNRFSFMNTPNGFCVKECVCVRVLWVPLTENVNVNGRKCLRGFGCLSHLFNAKKKKKSNIPRPDFNECHSSGVHFSISLFYDSKMCHL